MPTSQPLHQFRQNTCSLLFGQWQRLHSLKTVPVPQLLVLPAGLTGATVACTLLGSGVILHVVEVLRGFLLRGFALQPLGHHLLRSTNLTIISNLLNVILHPWSSASGH